MWVRIPKYLLMRKRKREGISKRSCVIPCVHLLDGIPNRNKLREEGFILAHSISGVSPCFAACGG